MSISDKRDVENKEIEKLERVLNDFQNEWEETRANRSKKWRMHFLIGFLTTSAISVIAPILWWTSLAVIIYFAASLFTLLRQNAKTINQIIEHKRQLKLAKLLQKFEASH